MGHNHSHGHGHSHDHSASVYGKINLSFAIAVFANLLFTLLEGGYAILAHSMGLLADAGHNLGDVLGLLLAWGANWLMTKPARDRYSYGYKRSSVLASLFNAFLLVATSAIIAYESILKLIYPGHINELIVIVVAAIGIVINGGTALLFFKQNKHDLNIKGAFLHLAADALLSLGVVITGIIVYYTGWVRLDAVIGLIIVVAIVMGTWDLLTQSLKLLLDAAPKHVDPQKVGAFLKSLPGVKAIHDLHIWGLSTREVALTAHLVMPNEGLSDADFDRINHQLLDDFSIHHVTLQVEKGDDESCVRDGTC
ncbi:MAG: cation diffusion facilitator family transporter [Gammaproteobacteria bacterium]|nr:cation diffusion facilitator family transporter [Gammaproteobacteria bacterium]